MRYRKLARNKRGIGKWNSLWLGEDHLLAVESTGYSEEYTRYYLKDIQAVVSRRTMAGKVWNALFGILAVLSLGAVLGGNLKGVPPVTVGAGICAGLFLVFLLWNVFRGPTCRCHLLTPVGKEELRPLDRVKDVKRALDRISPLIGPLQGEISREEITELVGMAKGAPPAAFPVAQPAAFAAQEAKNSALQYRGGVHRAAFLVLLADSVLSALQLLHNSKALVSLSTFVSLAFLILGIVALVKQKDYLVTPLAKLMTWLGVATLVTGSIVSYFFLIVFNIEKLQVNKDHVLTQNDLLDLYAAIQPAEHPSFGYFITFYAAVTAGIAVIGLIALGAGRRRAAGSLP